MADVAEKASINLESGSESDGEGYLTPSEVSFADDEGSPNTRKEPDSGQSTVVNQLTVIIITMFLL